MTTLTRALVELKTLDKQIEHRMNIQVVCGIAKGIGDKRTMATTAMSIAEAEQRIKADVQSFADLIERRIRLKQAVIAANSSTKVTIAGKEYTIASAIETKRMIAIQEEALRMWNAALARAETAIQTGNQKLNEEIEKAMVTAFAGDKGKLTPEMYAAVADPRKAQHELSLVDPTALRKRIDVLQDYITKFTADVDVALSEVNAHTEISV